MRRHRLEHRRQQQCGGGSDADETDGGGSGGGGERALRVRLAAAGVAPLLEFDDVASSASSAALAANGDLLPQNVDFRARLVYVLSSKS